MMTSQDKELIARLLKKYAAHVPTEGMIAFVAKTNGMLAACRLLVSHNKADDQESMRWVDEQCYDRKVDVRGFLGEVNQILSIFQPGQESDAYYDILGLEVGAGQEEIKQAYRKLSLRYHPDTAASGGAGDADTFVQINKAYHALITDEREEPEFNTPQTATGHWRQRRRRTVSRARKQQSIFWFSVLAVGMIVISLFAANGYRKRAMLAGLQHSRAVFTPQEPGTEEERAKPERAPLPDQSVAVAAPALVDPGELREEAAGAEGEAIPTEAGSLMPPGQEVITGSMPQGEAAAPVTGRQGNRIGEERGQPLLHTDKDGSHQLSTGLRTRAGTTRAPRTLVPSETPPVLVITTPDNERKRVVKPAENEAESIQGAVASSPPGPLALQEIERGAPPPEQSRADMQKRLEIFLAAYLNAYEQKDLLSFSRFFDLQATENGKPLGEILPTYNDLFQAAESISLVVSVLKWQREQEKIRLDGRFAIQVVYKNSHKVEEMGEITFLLADLDHQFSIKELTYHFDHN